MVNRMPNGGSFGPRLRKPSIEKTRGKMMKKCLKEYKTTWENYRLSRPSRYNNVDGQQDNRAALKKRQIPLEKPCNVRGSQPNNLKRSYSSRSNNCLDSSHKITMKSRLSSSWSNNCLVSSQKNTEKSRPFSSKPSNDFVLSLKNTKKLRPSSSRSSNGVMPSAKNTKKFMPSCTRPSNDAMFSAKNIEESRSSCSGPNIGTISSTKNAEKSRPSRYRDELSLGKFEKPTYIVAMDQCNTILHEDDSRTKDDSNFTPRVLKKSLSSPLVAPAHITKNVGAVDQRNNILHEDDESEEVVYCRSKKKRRRYIDNEDHDGDDKNLVGVEGLTAGLTTQASIDKDSCAEVSEPFVSESVKLQHYSKLPMDEPIWSGIFKIDSNEYVAFGAHLSPKSCEKVWELSRSLPPVVEVIKLPRLGACPESFLASKPNVDNIALYFLPLEMRPDKDMDQLVKDVMENDMILRAVVGEAEILIFPSILLPEQHQTFKSKPYLWGVFRPREDKVVVVEEHRGTGCCAHEEEMGKQHLSCHHMVKEGNRVSGLNLDGGLQAPEEAERQGIEQEPGPSLAGLNAPSPAEGAARPTSAPTTAAAMSASHGQVHSSLTVSTGAVFAFVVQETPRFEELIREMDREGALVVAMRGEMIGSGLGWPVGRPVATA